VEKIVGYAESILACTLIELLRRFIKPKRLGIVLGEGGTLRILLNQIRVPDVCFISWKRFPGEKLPKVPVPSLAPNLAIEILSVGNTPGEMARKLREYFEAGVELVWYIDPRKRTVEEFTAIDQRKSLGEDDVLEGGSVLPGFELPLRTLFAELDELPPDMIASN